MDEMLNKFYKEYEYQFICLCHATKRREEFSSMKFSEFAYWKQKNNVDELKKVAEIFCISPSKLEEIENKVRNEL